MLVILSPSKDMTATAVGNEKSVNNTLPVYLKKADKLVGQLRNRKPGELAEQMKINTKLAELNCIRFQQWNIDHTTENARSSILSYTGEAYRGLMAQQFSQADLEYAQQTLRILSGLYGIIRPLDLIQAYRLEIGLGIAFKGIKNLYEYWREPVTKALNEAIAASPGEKFLLNLASAEYSSVIDFKKLKYPVISPAFKEEKSGQYKMVTVYTKHARGAMARYVIQNRIEQAEALRTFTDGGYCIDNALSTGNNMVFVR